MADQAGIELILSAPDVKPIMDQVIDDWKEINRQEKLATEQLEKYNEEVAKEQSRLKDLALGNQKIRDTVKELDNAEKGLAKTREANIDKVLFAQEHEQKGIFAAIRGYFQQKKELKGLGVQIDSVTDQLRKLDLRQQSISLSARRGNSVAIKEYNANAKAITDLNSQLSTLNEKYNVTNAKLELSKGKFAGLNKIFAIIKTGAIAAAAAMALIGVAGLAVIVAIGKQNDQVKNQFKKTSDAFKKARTEFADALAPVAFAFGKIFENMANSFSTFLSENSDAIFAWARNLAGIVGGLAQSIPVEIDKIRYIFKKITADVEYSLAVLKLASTAILAPKEVRDAAIANYDKAAKRVIDLGNEIAAQPETTAEAYKRGYDDMVASIDKVNFKQRNLTQEQIDAIKKLRAEYAKLLADINKQIEALNVQEAGPFTGVLLKAELAAREIDAIGEKAVLTAQKLGESQKKVNEIRTSVARLSKAVRDDAVKFLSDQADDIIDKVNERLEELRSKRAGTNDNLQFTKNLEAQAKELNTFLQIQTALLEDALNKGASASEIDKLNASLQEGLKIAAQLEQNTILEFTTTKAIEQLERLKKAAEKTLSTSEAIGERLQTSLEQISGNGDVEFLKSIQLKIKVNDIDIAVAKEQIRQFEEAFKLFKETGVTGVIETEAQIRVKVQQEQGINNIQPGEIVQAGKKAPALSITEGLDLAVGLTNIAYTTITDIALRSVDAQIEALELLNQARNDSVNNLQDQLANEALFKAEGLANDYEITKKQLADAIKLQEDGAKKQEDLNKKRAKIQQQQDDIQTLSSITTSVANIIKGWSTVPFVGTALGIAAAAAMLVSFAAAKIQARKLTRAYKGSRRMGDTFGEFAPGEGYDDSPGTDRGLSVVDNKGRLRGFVGGDEYLHKQSVSKKHRNAFDYLNKNESKFQNVNLLAMLKSMENVNINQVFDVPDFAVAHFDMSRVVAKNEKLRDRMIVVKAGGGISKSDLKEAVREVIKEQTDTMIAYHESRPDIIPTEWMKDYTERTSKSKKHFKQS